MIMRMTKRQAKKGEAILPYVSITGLRVRSFWHWPRFAWHAVRSMMQARKADGCLRAEAKSIAGVQHTLSVWTDKNAMRAFMMNGAHREAMRDFRKIADGSTYGYESEQGPDWREAHRLWTVHGKSY